MKTQSILTATLMMAGVFAASPLQQTHAQAVVPAAVSSIALESDEQQHFMETLQNGGLSLEVSRVARVKASNKYVKMFADSEVAEQETVAEVLTAMAPTITPPVLSKEGKALVKNLNKVKPGPAFDKMYLEAQLAGHKELLKTQDDYLAGGDVLAQVSVAKLIRGQVLDHIKALEAMISGIQQ